MHGVIPQARIGFHLGKLIGVLQQADHARGGTVPRLLHATQDDHFQRWQDLIDCPGFPCVPARVEHVRHRRVIGLNE